MAATLPRLTAFLADVKAALASQLETWMADQGDPGAPQDTPEALQAARKLEHLYGPADQE